MRKRNKDFQSSLKSILMNLFVTAVCIVVGLSSVTFADDKITSLKDMSLEELMNINITSVSKRSEKMTDAPAAVYVMTGEEIRRLGARNIPDALRSVPGLHIASVDASTWAISSRGFNGSLSNKLLVLIDGRTVYNQLFSGVWWDVQDVIMEDIDRIEVIRGPGATMWGANAVNGVINVITKNADKTQGGTLTLGAGTEDHGYGVIKYGKELGENTFLRVYSKYFNRDEFDSPMGLTSTDKWSQGRFGFRLDNKYHDNKSISIQGEYYRGIAHAAYLLPTISDPYQMLMQEETDLTGGHIVGSWMLQAKGGNTASFKTYFDYAKRSDSFIGNYCWMADAEFQHSYHFRKNSNIVWGFGYRHSGDHSSGGEHIALDPAKSEYSLYNGFFQLEHALIPNKLKVTAGAKLEYNSFTKYEFQPSLRTFWHINNHNSIWSSLSRAVRTPSRGERQGSLFMATLPPLSASNDSPIPIKIVYEGSDQSISESVFTWELGYRSDIFSNISMDFVAFHSWYSNMLYGVLGTPDISNMPFYVILPIDIKNIDDKKTYGVEISSNMQLGSKTTIRTSYSYAHAHGKTYTLAGTENMKSFEAQAPEHQFNINLFYNPTSKLDLSGRLRYVGELQQIGIEEYLTLDLRTAYNLSDKLEVSVIGQDLFDSDRIEYIAELLRQSTLVESRIFVQLNWKF